MPGAGRPGISPGTRARDNASGPWGEPEVGYLGGCSSLLSAQRAVSASLIRGRRTAPDDVDPFLSGPVASWDVDCVEWLCGCFMGALRGIFVCPAIIKSSSPRPRMHLLYY